MSLFTKNKISEIRKNCMDLNENIFNKQEIFKTLMSEINFYNK